MAYTIHKSDGTPISIPDNTVDAAYYNGTGGTLGLGMGLTLLGRNTIDYGQSVAQDFLQMVENFASTPVPADATSLQGQLWFNKTSGTAGKLYVRVSGANTGGILNWQQIVTTNSSGTTIIGGDVTVTGNEVVQGDLTVNGSEHVLNNLVVDGTITAEGGLHVPVVFHALPVLPQVAQDGDMLIIGSVISVYAAGAWRQIFPAVYS